jgi:hypothetical protein
VALAVLRRDQATARGRTFISREKEHANGEFILWPLTQSLGFPPKEPQRQLSEQACSVSSFAVGIDGSSVRQVAKSFKSALDDLMGGASGNIGDESHSARIVLVERVIQQFVAGFVSHLSPGLIDAFIGRRTSSLPGPIKIMEQ